jgi:hypothetical protein
MRHALVFLFLLGSGCRVPASSTEDPASAADGGPCDRAPCHRNIDCGGGLLCSIPDGGGAGCCVVTSCLGDEDCRPLARYAGDTWACNVATAACFNDNVPWECTPGVDTTCAGGRRCLGTTDDQGRATARCL